MRDKNKLNNCKALEEMVKNVNKKVAKFQLMVLDEFKKGENYNKQKVENYLLVISELGDAMNIKYLTSELKSINLTLYQGETLLDYLPFIQEEKIEKVKS